jgi:hypothetical protein
MYSHIYKFNDFNIPFLNGEKVSFEINTPSFISRYQNPNNVTEFTKLRMNPNFIFLILHSQQEWTDIRKETEKMGKHNTAYYTTQKLRMRFEIRKYECDISEKV